MTTRKTGLAALAAAATIGLAGPAAAQTNLTVMVFQGMQNLPLFAAQSHGFFAKRGLKVEVKIAPNSDELRNGLAEGRYQIVHSAADNAVAMVAMAKVDTAIVIGGDDGLNHLFVQPTIATVADLRGKTVAVDAPNTAYAFQLYDMLRRAGLDKGDYAIKPVGATFKRLAALEQDKTLAASMLNPPFSIRAQKAGLKDLGEAVKALGPYQATSGFVLRAWAKEHPDVLVNYLAAYLEGLRWAKDPQNKAEAIRLYVDHLKLPADIAAECYAQAATALAKDAAFDMPGFKNVLALRARYTGVTPQAPETYVDLSYYRKALAGL